MSLLKFIKAQLGNSSTPSNNFTLDASAQDGSLKLSRGNAGATTQDVMVVDGSGKVTFPSGSEMLGVGQTWQNVTASRAAGVEYTNTSGKPIVVGATSVSTNGATNSILLVSGHKVDQSGGGAIGWSLHVTGIVPNGAVYKVQNLNANIENWVELR